MQWCVSLRYRPQETPARSCPGLSHSKSSLPRNAETYTSRKLEPPLVTHRPPCSLFPLAGVVWISQALCPLPSAPWDPGSDEAMALDLSQQDLHAPCHLFSDPSAHFQRALQSLSLRSPIHQQNSSVWFLGWSVRGDACSFVELEVLSTGIHSKRKE